LEKKPNNLKKGLVGAVLCRREKGETDQDQHHQ